MIINPSLPNSVEKTPSWSRAHVYSMAALALGAALVRVPIAFSRGWIGYDEANYLMIARNAEAGFGYVQSTLTTYAPKFHCLSFLAPQLLTRITGDELHASNMIFIMLGAVTTALIGVLGAALFGTRVGLVAAALTAVAPVLTSLLVASISHSLFLPAFVGGLWLAWKAAYEAKPMLALVSGLAIGTSWWARADGLLAAPAIACFLIFGGTLYSGFRRSLATTAAYSAGFGVMYGAYSAFVAVISDGTSKPHGPLYDFLLRPPSCEFTRDLSTYESFLQLVLAEPHCIIQAIIENAQVAPETLLTWTGFPLILLPLLGASWVAEPHYNRRILGAHLLLLLAIIPLAFYLPFYYAETRYVAPYAAVAFIWCAHGLLAVGKRLKPILGNLGYILPSVLLVGFLVIVTTLHLGRMEAIGGASFVEAGKWIDENTGSKTLVWTSQSQVAYYARRPWIYPPAPDKVEQWPRLSGHEILLVVDQHHFKEKNQRWAELLPPGSSDGFEHLFTTQSKAPRVAVYHVQRDSARAIELKRK